MTQVADPSDVAIRLAAVEAAGRRLGATPEPLGDHRNARGMAAEDVIATAMSIVHYIKTGLVEY